MFDPRSRYFELEQATFKLPDGREVAYKRRRFLPPPSAHTELAAAVVEQNDRLDLIAARTLGDPEQFWRICDANGALDPGDLLVSGRRLTIPVPTQ